MSPAKKAGAWYVHSKYRDFNKNINRYSFINSCMCINAALFKEVIYDENLFLDCVDYDFINMIRQVISKDIFYIMKNIEIYQNFSGVTSNTFESDLARFKIYVKDFRYYSKKWNKKNVSSILFKRALKLVLIHKNFIFFKILNTQTN